MGVLEQGEYPCPESWGFPQPFVCSLRPLRMVGPLKLGHVCAGFETVPSDACLSTPGTFEGGASARCQGECDATSLSGPRSAPTCAETRRKRSRSWSSQHADA